LSGCGGPSFEYGHYEGQIQEGTLLFKDISPYSLIGLDFRRGQKNSVLITVNDVHNKNSFEIQISKRGFNSYFLQIPEIGPLVFKPKRYFSETPFGTLTCYNSQEDYIIDICTETNEFKLSVKDKDERLLLSLVAGRFNRDLPFELEDPVSLTLNEAVQIALKKNFASRIEYRQMMQAQKRISESYLNLLPSARFFSAVCLTGFVLTLNPFSLIYGIGDVAPFLFPTRWFNAVQAKYQAIVAQDSYRIMQANLAHEVEGMVYKTVLYREQVAIYNQVMEMVSRLREPITVLLEKYRMDKYADETLEMLTYQLESGRGTAQSNLKSVLQGLSGTLGYLNLNAITDIRMEESDLPKAPTRALNSQLLGRLSRNRSLEARQIQILRKAAKLEKTAMYFQWLDPGGDPSMGFGFNLIPQNKIANESIAILMDQENECLQKATQSGVRSAEAFNSLLIAYQQSLLFANRQKKRLNHLLDDLKDLGSNEVPVSFSQGVRSGEISAIVQDYLTAALAVPDIMAQLRIVQSKIERHLLVGYFSVLNQSEKQFTLGDLQQSCLPDIERQVERQNSVSLSQSSPLCPKSLILNEDEFLSQSLGG